MKNNFNKQPYLLHGKVRNYDWGGYDFIPKLLGINSQPNTPHAEYWLGAHEQAPSTINFDNNITMNLCDMLQDNPAYFTQNTQEIRDYKFPFLLKILDVKKMLSIQIHPNLAEASTGYEAENKHQIPFNSPLRVFKDRNHKPEMMIALSKFWLIHGFAPQDIINSRLSKYQSLKKIADDFDNQHLETAFKKLMLLPKNAQTEIIHDFLLELEPLHFDKNSAEFWIKKYTQQVSKDLLNDIGIISILYFNIVALNYKESIFQAPGLPHAYLEGQNIEIMTNSDNVIRGGLTVKHIDINLFLEHLNFSETIPYVYKPIETSKGLVEYSFKECNAFGATWLELSLEQSYHCITSKVEIMLCIQGLVRLAYIFEGQACFITISKGEALLIPIGFEYHLTTKEFSILVKSY
ncbi:MAG: mannose-6-phosphate isomerase, class I [Alphaproteobacteria bacterium]|nr:mannose-6-phosphate isomerase, class I [Alphaproteobacteria bacterium]